MGILYSKGVRYSGSGKIDATLSTSSANAIANSAVATAINQINSDLTELSDDVTEITTDLTPTFQQYSNVSNYVAYRNVWRWGKWRRIEFHLKDVAYTSAGQPYQIDTLSAQDRPTSATGVNNDAITYSGYIFRVTINPSGAVVITPNGSFPSVNGIIAMIFIVN